MQSPCKGCVRREQGCHSSCEQYLEFRRKREQANARRNADVDMIGYAISAMARIRGKKRK